MGSTVRYLANGVSSSEYTQFFMCDTIADLPATGIAIGDQAYVKATGQFWAYTSQLTWTLSGDTTKIEADILDLQRSFLLLLRNLVSILGEEIAVELEDKIDKSFEDSDNMKG